MEAEVERPQLEPLQEVMGPAEEVHRDPSEADMNLHIFAARVGPVHVSSPGPWQNALVLYAAYRDEDKLTVQVHGELAKKQEVHPPQVGHAYAE